LERDFDANLVGQGDQDQRALRIGPGCLQINDVLDHSLGCESLALSNGELPVRKHCVAVAVLVIVLMDRLAIQIFRSKIAKLLLESPLPVDPVDLVDGGIPLPVRKVKVRDWIGTTVVAIDWVSCRILDAAPSPDKTAPPKLCTSFVEVKHDGTGAVLKVR